MIENEMIHGRLPRLRNPRQQSRLRSAHCPEVGINPLSFPEHEGWGEWDVSARFYKESQTRREKTGEPDRWPQRVSNRIEDDTPIVPSALAEQICEEAGLWLGEAFPRKWMLELAERANVVYQHNARFRQLLRKAGDKGRDWLAAFMRHRLYALLASRRPDLCQRLPRSFANGRDLPPPTSRP
ncbi:MAG: hypothetical protein QOJ40_2572 [Verrucomicrobiota bacterium]